jgi:hypothetical protein
MDGVWPPLLVKGYAANTRAIEFKKQMVGNQVLHEENWKMAPRSLNPDGLESWMESEALLQACSHCTADTGFC